MSRNGERRPPRPRIAAISGAPDAEQAAAIVAGIERFLAEHAPAPAPADPVSRWQRAALLEGVERDPGADVWGGAPRR